MENNNLSEEVNKMTELLRSEEILLAINKISEGFKPIAEVFKNHRIFDTLSDVSNQISAVLSKVNSLNFTHIVLPDIYTALPQQFKNNLPSVTGNISSYSGANITNYNPAIHTFNISEKTVYLRRNQVLNVHLIDDKFSS